MRPWVLAAALALLLAPDLLAAKPLASSPRPLPRPLAIAALPLPKAQAAAEAQAASDTQSPPEAQPGLAAPRPAWAAPRPLPKPQSVSEHIRPAAPPAKPDAQAGQAASVTSIRPLPRPKGLGAAAAAPAPLGSLFGRTKPTPEKAPTERESLKGSVCGVPGLIGQSIPPIRGTVKGCGLSEGVKLVSVSGVRLAQGVTVDCPTAIALKRWVDKGITPAVGKMGGGLAKLDLGPGYTCRTRNNQRGGKISEHGRGRAVDLMSLTLKDGKTIPVLSGWKSHPKLLKAIHTSACGPFGTVLGPKADRYHQNHIHVDTARYRSGPYCR